MVSLCLSARRLPGRGLRPPSGRYRSPTLLLCCPFLRRVRWRERSPRPAQRPILHIAFLALRNRPQSGFLCRCYKRSSYSYSWIAADSFFGAAAGEARPKRNICYNDQDDTGHQAGLRTHAAPFFSTTCAREEAIPRSSMFTRAAPIRLGVGFALARRPAPLRAAFPPLAPLC